MNQTRTVVSITPLATLAIAVLAVTLTGCGTITGIPAHGGGKRYAEEQRLVSASIRSALKDIDVSPLKGKRAALVFDIVADEGGGNMSGGRISPAMLFSVGSMMSPVTSTSSAFQIFNLAEGGNNYSSTSGGSSNSASTVTVSNGSGTNTGTNSSNSTGSGTNTSNTNNSGTNTSTTNSSGSNTSAGTNASSGTNSTTTGGITSNGDFNQTGSNTGTGTNTGTSTTNGSNTGTSATTGSNTNTAATAGTNSGSNTSTGTSTSTQSGGSDNFSNTGGGYNTSRQTISPGATSSTSKTEGRSSEKNLSLVYKGLGEYQNMAVPKSDASLLMGLVRNYLLFSGVTPTVPTDPNAEVLVYVTVDVFGTVRSRFDVLANNNETVKAETSFEISAFDKTGKMIMRPTVANREAQYREHYLMWTGPFVTTERINQGTGLLVDFTDVDGSKPTYNKTTPVAVDHVWGKN